MTSIQTSFFLRKTVKHYEVKGSAMLDNQGTTKSRWRHNFSYGVLTTDIESACHLAREHIIKFEANRNPQDVQIHQVNQRSHGSLLLVDPRAVQENLLDHNPGE